MMANKISYEPVIYEYLKKYQTDPSSRIFAPLAEAYRKAGLIDEAIEIAREGLRIHPKFAGGVVALGRALFDKKQFSQVIDELSWVVRDVPDNLIAQKLVAESCLMLGRAAEALGAYKMLLYFSPQDRETAQIVQELESDAYEEGVLVLRTDLAQEPQYSIESASTAVDGDPENRQKQWIGKIEFLQGLLQRIERYRTVQVQKF